MHIHFSFLFVCVICLNTFEVKKFQATFLADGDILRLLLLIPASGEAEDPVRCRAKEKDACLDSKMIQLFLPYGGVVFFGFFWARGCFFFPFFFSSLFIRLIDDGRGKKKQSVIADEGG